MNSLKPIEMFAGVAALGVFSLEYMVLVKVAPMSCRHLLNHYLVQPLSGMKWH
jgi:hypothetical protein